jgi:hypothetical protein
VYLVLGMDAMRGRLWWDWVKRVRGVEIAQVLRAWKATGVGDVGGLYGLSQSEDDSGGRAAADISAVLFA